MDPGERRQRRRNAPALTEDEKQELRESFDLFDADKTGTIDLHELKVLMRALGFQVKKTEVIKFVHGIDPHNDGCVNYDQYMDIMTERYGERDPDEEIMKVCGEADRGRDGRMERRKERRGTNK